MLAMAQNPEITYINSLEVWNRLGRSVNRDENGMKIRVSDTYVKDGREYHGYKIGRVFDVTQTHGKAGVPALSLKDNTPEMDAALRRLLDSSPVPVVTSSTMYQDAVYDPKTQSITVSSRLIDSKIFAALSREIVHAGIHDHGRYPYYTREDCAMDAESVSYMKQDIIDRTNALRKENGVAVLRVNDRLMQAAQVRADEMTAHTVYSHTRPDGRKFNTVTDCPYMTENIHRIADWVLSDQTLAERAVADWSASTTHNKNMVNPKLSEIGVGLARGVNDTGDPCWYCVQLFLYDGCSVTRVDTPTNK